MKKFSMLEWMVVGAVVLIILSLVVPVITKSHRHFFEIEQTEEVGKKEARFNIKHYNHDGNQDFVVYIFEDRQSKNKYLILRSYNGYMNICPFDDSKVEVEE